MDLANSHYAQGGGKLTRGSRSQAIQLQAVDRCFCQGRELGSTIRYFLNLDVYSCSPDCFHVTDKAELALPAFEILSGFQHPPCAGRVNARGSVCLYLRQLAIAFASNE